ncbi:MAG: hypothetical protein IJL91_01450 [Bacteroidales bacterium]|nr:hypothetical protein [Bacteroidales bacterium]
MKLLASIFLAISLFFPQYGISGDSRFEPTTTWPYLFEDFSPGTVLTNKGNTLDYDKLNVNVINGKMHFVKDDKIMEIDMMTVYVVRVKEDVFLNVQGKLMKVMKETENGAVVSLTEVDKEKMSRTSIGYGTSAIASTQNISTAALESNSGSIINKSLGSATVDRFAGDPLILMKTTYLVVDGLLLPARKKDVISDARFNSKQVEDYIKQHKTKWNNTDNLSELVEFLHTVKTN